MPIHEIEPLVLHYRIRVPGKSATDLRPFIDEVAIMIARSGIPWRNGNPGGGSGEFEEYMRQCLAEWYETDQVELMGGNNEQETAKD